MAKTIQKNGFKKINFFKLCKIKERMAPANVKDPKLYDRVKKSIDSNLEKQGRRWSLYASSELVRKYKKAYEKKHGSSNAYFGKIDKSKGINRWFAEEWVNVNKLPKIVKCGRTGVKDMTYAQLKKQFPYCRPLKKVSSETPKTVKEISKKDLQKIAKTKRSAPKKIVQSSKN